MRVPLTPVLESASQLEALARGGSWTLEFPSQTCTWSAGLWALLGIEPGSVAASPAALLAFVVPQDRRRVAAALRRLLRDGKPYELTYRVQLPSGLEQIVLQAAYMRYHATGEPAYAVGTLVDFTVQQHTRKKLDDATATLIATWEHVPEGQLLVDVATGIVVDANPFVERVRGRARADIAERLSPFSSRRRAANAPRRSWPAASTNQCAALKPRCSVQTRCLRPRFRRAARFASVAGC